MRFKHLMRPWERFARTPEKPPPLSIPVAVLDPTPPDQLIATALGGDESLRAAAQERVAQLINAGTLDFGEVCAPPGNPVAVLAVAALCDDPAHLPRALALIEDPRQIAHLVIDGSSSRLRQLAAQRIEDPDELRRLLKLVRDKDKSVYKIIKQKCDVLRAEEQRIAQLEAAAASVCASIERHSHRFYDALYATSLKLYEEEWRTLEAQATADIRERARQAIDRSREVIAARVRQETEQADAKSRQAALEAARREASTQADVDAKLRHEAAAQAAAEAAKVREAEAQAHAARQGAEALALRQVGGLIAKAQGELRDGHTGRAAGLRRAIEDKLAALPLAPPHLTKQVQKLDDKLNELKAWKDYAVAPKRAELIDEMAALIGVSEEPKVLAERIKQLQEQWKTISKGIVIDSGEDWERFHRASRMAYEPCRDYFEAQARLRQENLEKRRAVALRLRDFETAQSGGHPDWRTLAAVLREAPQEWRRHFPVERAAGLAVQEEFDATLGRLQSRLDAWHAQNVADKKSLIQRAQQLSAQQDGREAVEAVKRLQLKWKEAGAVPRDQDRQLWEEFREQCDAIFQKRQQAHVEYTAQLETNRAQAAALCAAAEQLDALDGTALLDAAAKIPEWRAAFEALGEMPRTDQRALHDRFDRALRRCEQRMAQQRARDQEVSFVNLLEAVRRIQCYGWPTLTGMSADREALKQAAETFVAEVRQWPKGGAHALKEAWSNAHSAADQDADANGTALRMLCIRSEIVTDAATPPEDQALRREYQVQRLVQHMGRQAQASADDLDALGWEWVRVGPVPAAAHAALLARFLRCRPH